jgi:hypothetical protein
VHLRIPMLLTLDVESASAAQLKPSRGFAPTATSFMGDGQGLGFDAITTKCRADFGGGSMIRNHRGSSHGYYECRYREAVYLVVRQLTTIGQLGTR